MRSDTFGLILAGGLARRMGGGDKPLRQLSGRPLLAYVIERLRPQVADLALNANGPSARFAEFGLPVLADPIPDYAGPLAGVLAGLDWLAARVPTMPWLVTASGDGPFLPEDLVLRLHQARLAAGAAISCAASGGFTQPPIGLWPVALRHDLRAALLSGERKIDRWTARHGCASAEWPTQPYDPFFNANTPEDLSRAEEILARAVAAPH